MAEGWGAKQTCVSPSASGEGEVLGEGEEKQQGHTYLYLGH